MTDKIKPLSASKAITEISDRSDYTKLAVREILDTLYDLMCVEIQRCGRFSIPRMEIIADVRKVKARDARIGRNPATGEPIEIAAKPESKKLRVRATRKLKNRVHLD